MFSKKLKLFQKNENSIWTDEHISKELLKCHLNDFTDGASRKLTKRNKILEFINNSIKKNSNILDLGCARDYLILNYQNLVTKYLELISILNQ